MKQHNFYDRVGNITHIIVCDEKTFDVQGDCFGYVIGKAAQESHYVDNGVLTYKCAMPVLLSAYSVFADGFDEVVLTGVPNGSVLKIGHEEVVADGTDIKLTSSSTGDIHITITHTKYLNEGFTINAT